MTNVIPFFVVVVIGLLLVGVFVWRTRYAWPPPGLKRDEFLRRRLNLQPQPRRRLLSRLHLPQLRLRR